MPPDEEVETIEEEVEVPSEEIEPDSEPSTNDDGLTEAEVKEAQNLYKLLKDPGTQKSVLRVLAEKAGVFQEPPTTQQEVQETKRDLMKILEEKLGPDLKWLAPKLGGALEEILEQEREESGKSLQLVERRDMENEVVRVSEKLNRETKGEYGKLENRMNQLADKILPAPGVSVEEYCRHLYAIASGEKGRNVEKNRLADKINRNANNASERLRSTSSSSSTTTSTSESGKKLTVREAVQQAAKQLEKK
jgi:hypothetical protein